jgi:hypothetical protein
MPSQTRNSEGFHLSNTQRKHTACGIVALIEVQQHLQLFELHVYYLLRTESLIDVAVVCFSFCESIYILLFFEGLQGHFSLLPWLSKIYLYKVYF